MYPPLVSMTDWHLLCIALIYFWHSSAVIAYQTADTLSQSSFIPAGGLSYPLNNRRFNKSHIFSMGLRSGDCDGHSITRKDCFASHSLTILDLCLGSLSCINTLGENLWTTFSKNTHNGVYIVKGAPPQDVINMFEWQQWVEYLFKVWRTNHQKWTSNVYISGRNLDGPKCNFGQRSGLFQFKLEL